MYTWRRHERASTEGARAASGESSPGPRPGRDRQLSPVHEGAVLGRKTTSMYITTAVECTVVHIVQQVQCICGICDGQRSCIQVQCFKSAGSGTFSSTSTGNRMELFQCVLEEVPDVGVDRPLS